MPNIEFNNITELQQYVDLTLVDNNSQSIRADEHNNIESGLVKFIGQAPRNWNKAKITNSPSGYQANGDNSMVLLGPNFNGVVNLVDNQWNEYTIVNLSKQQKNLGGVAATYYTPGGAARTYIKSSSVLKLVKGENGNWYEVDNSVSINIDGSVEEGSENAVSSNAVYEALQDVQVEVDPEVQEGSTKPVESNGVYEALGGLSNVKQYVDQAVSGGISVNYNNDVAY